MFFINLIDFLVFRKTVYSVIPRFFPFCDCFLQLRPDPCKRITDGAKKMRKLGKFW